MHSLVYLTAQITIWDESHQSANIAQLTIANSVFYKALDEWHSCVAGGYLCKQIVTLRSSMSRLHSSTLLGVIAVRHVVVSISSIHLIQCSAADLIETVIRTDIHGEDCADFSRRYIALEHYRCSKAVWNDAVLQKLVVIYKVLRRQLRYWYWRSAVY